MIHGTLATGFGHALAAGGVGHEGVDAAGEIAGEFFGTDGFKRAFGLLFERNKETGFAFDDDFLDATDGGGDDGGCWL